VSAARAASTKESTCLVSATRSPLSQVGHTRGPNAAIERVNNEAFEQARALWGERGGSSRIFGGVEGVEGWRGGGGAHNAVKSLINRQKYEQF
jgi:hypothetical protein